MYSIPNLMPFVLTSDSNSIMSACEDPVKGDYKIGIVQEIEHGALDAAREGFQTELTRLMTEAGKTVGFRHQTL